MCFIQCRGCEIVWDFMNWQNKGELTRFMNTIFKYGNKKKCHIYRDFNISLSEHNYLISRIISGKLFESYTLTSDGSRLNK